MGQTTNTAVILVAELGSKLKEPTKEKSKGFLEMDNFRG